MSANVQASPDDIDLTSVWSRVRTALPRLALASLVVGLVTYLVLTLVPAQYTSVAQIKISPKGASDSFLKPKTASGSPENISVQVDKEAVATEVIAVRSPELATKLAADLKLARRPEFNSALPSGALLDRLGRIVGLVGPRAGETEESRVLSAYYKALQVYQGKDSRVIVIEFTSQNPALAAQAANRLAELYQERLASQTVKETKGASDFLNKQIASLTEEVKAAEAEAKAFRAKAGLFEGDPQKGTLNDQQLSDLNGELSRVKAQLSEAEARASSARDMARRGSAEALPDVQKSPLIARLVEQRVRVERQVSELSATLLPAHPRMRQLNADLGGLNKQIKAEVSKLVESLEREVKVAGLRVKSVQASLDDMKSRVVSSNDDQVKLRALDSRAKSKRVELETLQANFEAARARGETKAVPIAAESLSRARISGVPVFPKKMPITILAVISTFILGLAWVITKGLLTGARPARVAPVAVREPVLAGSVVVEDAPTVPQNPVPIERINIARGASSQTAAVAVGGRPGVGRPATGQGFATLSNADELTKHVLAAGGGQLGYRTLITHAETDRSPSHEALKLALALGHADRKTVLVDWTAKGTRVSRIAGTKDSPGVAELLTGKASFEDVIMRIPNEPTHLIGVGNVTAVPNTDVNRLNLVLDALDEAYDHVVIVADRDTAHNLFATIEGRFDMGILVDERAKEANLDDASGGRFLGFEVVDIEVVRLLRAERPAIPRSRMQLARGTSREASV